MPDSRHRRKRLAQEKAERLYERLGPVYRNLEPDFVEDIKDWIEYDPDGAFRIVARISKAAVFNPSQVKIREGGAEGGRTKAALHKHYEQALIDLAKPFAAKLARKELNFLAVAKLLENRIIPQALVEAEREWSPNIEALIHLKKLSVSRLQRIILMHNKEIVSPSP